MDKIDYDSSTFTLRCLHKRCHTVVNRKCRPKHSIVYLQSRQDGLIHPHPIAPSEKFNWRCMFCMHLARKLFCTMLVFSSEGEHLPLPWQRALWCRLKNWTSRFHSRWQWDASVGCVTGIPGRINVWVSDLRPDMTTTLSSEKHNVRKLFS